MCRHAFGAWFVARWQCFSTAYQLFVNNAIFSWKSSLSSIVATSVCEAEHMAFTSCACEVVYARKLAGELGFTQLGPTKIYEDTGSFRDIETTFFDPASVFLSTH